MILRPLSGRPVTLDSPLAPIVPMRCNGPASTSGFERRHQISGCAAINAAARWLPQVCYSFSPTVLVPLRFGKSLFLLVIRPYVYLGFCVVSSTPLYLPSSALRPSEA